MDPIHPWLDADEVRRLAARLMQPVADPATAVSDAGFDEDFVGYATAARPPAPPADPPGSPTLPQRPAAPAPPESAAIPTGVRGPFLDRVRQFRDWMHRQFGATGLFLLDREGAVIFDESSHGRLHFLARSLALASRRQGASTGNVHVKIGAGATLEVIPVDTPYGCLVLGAVVPESLPPDRILAVRQALEAVAGPLSPDD